MLSVLIASQLKTITPMLLIPRALDKTPRLDAIAKAESMSIASAQELYLRACKRPKCNPAGYYVVAVCHLQAGRNVVAPSRFPL